MAVRQMSVTLRQGGWAHMLLEDLSTIKHIEVFCRDLGAASNPFWVAAKHFLAAEGTEHILGCCC